jgi:hypothetical protein
METVVSNEDVAVLSPAPENTIILTSFIPNTVVYPDLLSRYKSLS